MNTEPEIIPEITNDSFFDGRLLIMQYKTGYRFSIDAVLLAFYAKPSDNARVLDLGCGSGVISLFLAYLYPSINIHGVEIQPQLADLAEKNAEANAMQKRVSIICNDLKKLKNCGEKDFDLVICNPPYRKFTSGRISPESQRAIARHEIHANLDDVLSTARRMLLTRGRIVLIYPAERTAELLNRMRHFHLEPKRLRMVHSSLVSEAKMILAEGVKAGRPSLKIDRPLVIYNEDGSYTEEMQAMLKGIKPKNAELKMKN